MIHRLIDGDRLWIARASSATPCRISSAIPTGMAVRIGASGAISAESIVSSQRVHVFTLYSKVIQKKNSIAGK